MKKLLLLLTLSLSYFLTSFAQEEPQITNSYTSEFESAYLANPTVPRGMLEAVAYTNTHIKHLAADAPESCTSMPRAYGVMGLTLDGKLYFRNNLVFISNLSGISVDEIIENPAANIMAFAKAYSVLKSQITLYTGSIKDELPILRALSELPDNGELANDFAMSSHLNSVLEFLNNPAYQQQFNLPDYNINFSEIFGEQNAAVLQSSHVLVKQNRIESKEGAEFTPIEKDGMSADYAPASWNAAASCNYSSRSGTAVSAVTIHTVQGSYAGCISWFQNCDAGVSAHYVVKSSDGQITQMVLESNKAWHVGSENPYTIGIEHEGYINDPSWYTTAMYNSSADLVRDITNSGYGIDPLRTFFISPAQTFDETLGGCTKIKGHKNFANQSHTDPGVNWNWERYYRLINNNPTTSTLTTCTGSLYDSGGSGADYPDDERKIWIISPTNATSVTLDFTAFNLETDWDYLWIYDGNSYNAPLLGVYTGTNSPGTITSSGGSLMLEFRSDCSTGSTGWAATWTCASNTVDITPPTTTVSISGNWQTQDFIATFNDADNVGVEKSFYQVLDFDGTEWRANNTHGFFSDNFDAAIHSDWTAASGNWSITGNNLVQSDEANTNSNIYAPLTQNLSNRYLYHWQGKIEGTGTNRRAGFHFFCDDGSQTNRGNSYFVWFRVDNSKLQFYKVVNDVFSLESEVAFTFNAAQWYDYKVIYDHTTGKTDVYVDNVKIGTWTDPSPYSNGSYISFRSGDCKYTVNDLKVYRSRNSTATITVGNSGDIRYQNPNSSTPSGRIKSIVNDASGNLSVIASQDVNVDWTAPNNIAYVNDGVGADIQTTASTTSLSANWAASSDPHSDLTEYFYAIGTSAGATDLVNWTSNALNTSVTRNGLSLTVGQTYYFSVRAIDGAGLMTNQFNSDGQLVDLSTGQQSIVNSQQLDIFPNPTNNLLTIQHNKTIDEIRLYDATGKLVFQSIINNQKTTIDVSSFAAGIYNLCIYSERELLTRKIVVSKK
ncbi:MAG: N-acetylmuramoyl-L-alanine amidase [Bacteroidia bacterium]